MLYQRSLEIEQRLRIVLALVRKGCYSTPMIAEEIRVSIPTISRAVTALRERGYDIQARKSARGWRYTLKVGRNQSVRLRKLPLINSRTSIKPNQVGQV